MSKIFLDNSNLDIENNQVIVSIKGTWLHIDIRCFFESKIIDITDQGLSFRESYSILKNGDINAVKDMLSGMRKIFL